MKKLFLNKDSFIYWVDLSKQIKEEQLNPHILDAQVRMLRGTMCAPLYEEVYTQFLDDTLTTENQTLLDDYMIPLLVFASYVNYLTTAGKRSTNTGIVKVTGTNTEQITREELKDIISENKEKRSFYQNALSDFLTNNTDTYPLFLDCCKTQKAGFSITSVKNNNNKYNKYNTRYSGYYEDKCCD